MRHVSLYNWVASQYINESHLGSYITTRRASTTRCTEPTTCARTALSTRPLPRYTLSHVLLVNESCPSCEWVMSLLWMSHVPPVNESCPFCEWSMSLMWMSHVTRAKMCAWRFCLPWYAFSHVPPANESCLSCEWAISRSMIHSTYMKVCAWLFRLVLCLGMHWVTSLLCMSHVPHVNESCHKYEDAHMALVFALVCIESRPSCEWVT